MSIAGYDPLIPPPAEEWLALEEGERIELVEDYHRKARIPLPNIGVHAALQAVVETQIAMGDELPVARIVQRLMAEGLDRHDALHCAGKALIESMSEIAREGATADTNERYLRKLESSTARDWLASAEPDLGPPRAGSRRRKPRQRFRP